MSAKWLCLAAVASLVRGDDKLSTDYTHDRLVRVESESSLEMETTSMKMERDGQPVDSPMGGMKNSTERKLAWVDKVLEREDGKPTKVRRKFEDLKQTMSFTFGDRDDSRDQEGALSGATLELTRGDGGAVEAKVIEGKADGDALNGHHLELALDALLPEGAKSAGDSWDLDKDQVVLALGLDMTKTLFPPPAEDASSSGGSGGGRGRGRGGFSRGGPSALQQIDWEGKATLESASEDYEGASCRVIKLEMKGQGTLEEPSFGGGGGRAFGLESSAPFETTAKAELTGRLLFDSAKRLPVRLEVRGKIEIHSKREGEFQGTSFKSESTMEGEVKLETSLSVEKE